MMTKEKKMNTGKKKGSNEGEVRCGSGEEWLWG